MMGRAGIVWALLLGSVGSAAGQAMDSEEGARQEIEAAVDARLAPISYDGAILYAYRPHAGQRAQFDAGYRDHLEWHRAKADRSEERRVGKEGRSGWSQCPLKKKDR